MRKRLKKKLAKKLLADPKFQEMLDRYAAVVTKEFLAYEERHKAFFEEFWMGNVGLKK